MSGLVFIPLSRYYIRRGRAGIPYWFRPKHYYTSLANYEMHQKNTLLISRGLAFMLLGGWVFASRYTDYSELLDENYDHGKVKLAVQFDQHNID
jgi:hypothetical protein